MAWKERFNVERHRLYTYIMFVLVAAGSTVIIGLAVKAMLESGR